MQDDPERTLVSGEGGPKPKADEPSPARHEAALPADQTLIDPRPFGAEVGEAPPKAIADLSGLDPEATIEARTLRRPEPPPQPEVAPPTKWGELKEVGREFLHRHEKKIWWLHTVYALSLGAFVATVAQKGFERARWLMLMLLLAWLLVVMFFRFFGTGAQQDFMTAWPGARRRFFIMTYLMKNLFQGMLFFLLPLYYRSSNLSAGTTVVLYLVAGCAILSTLDLVFDRVLLRFKLIASLFFAITLFGSMNVAVPALLPNTRSLVVLLLAGGFSVATFFLFHVPLDALRRPLVLGSLVGSVFLGVLGFYAGRRAFPAVPAYLKSGGVGSHIAADGTLDLEFLSIKESATTELVSVTDIGVVGHADGYVHVWRKDGKVVASLPLRQGDFAPSSDRNIVRVASHVPKDKLPAALPGKWTVDIETGDGQLVGRVGFLVRP